MSTDEQAQGQASGSVPHAYRNALFWRWAPSMPKGLTSSFVTVLYALASAADPAGRVRFRDGKAIRIKDIATACKADEKDVRRYIQAAIVAGVVAVQGEQRRGRASLYVLILSPNPDWDAAASSLSSTRRKSRQAPPWLSEKNGGVTPELAETENGGHAPELPASDHEEERGTHPRMGSGDTPPFGSGDTPPNNPGVAKELPQEAAEVVVQPQPSGAFVVHKIDFNQDDEHPEQPLADFVRCALCHTPMIPRPGRTTHTHCTERTAS
ncbi:hypothetical protein AB0D99_10490 [Streptomyces sp. NPDC047971]|uniref:hypothetical protein n=1 Tax=Streptomyces sp. NPDC047971 TaxID=3154499 RepID=UPI0033E1F83E